MRIVLIVIFALTLLTTCLPAGAAEYEPCLMYSTVLNGLKMLPNTGQFRMDNIQAVFLPEAQSAAGMIYPYNPDDGGKLWAILSKSDGTQLFRFDFYGEKLKSPYWLLGSYRATDLASGADAGVGYIDLAQTGDYVVDFYLESGKFYTFPFSVRKLPSPDPFAGEDKWVLDGAWRDWGYFYYPDANVAMPLQFKVWLRSPEYGNIDYKPVMEIYRGSTLIATGRQMTLSLRPDWVRYELDVIFPMEGTSGGAYFKAGDLLAVDGDYTLKLKLDGSSVYGEWPFEVSGGKLEYIGRTVRGQADPLTFIEGGRDAWWYERRQ